MSKTPELIKEIKEGLTQTSSSQKAEVRVMQSMLMTKIMLQVFTEKMVRKKTILHPQIIVR